MRDLVIEAHRQVCCVPVYRKADFGIPYRLGAYLPNGDFLAGVTLRRNYGISGRAAPQAARHVMAGEFIYGGLLRQHFGHFLLETLARAWALQRHPDLPVVWHMGQTLSLTSWQNDIFKLLGVDTGRFHFVLEPTEFEVLHLPEVGYRIPDWAHADQISALARYPFRAPKIGCKLWLSRSRLPEEAGSVKGVSLLEEQLEEDSWRVIHPQEFDIGAQLEMMADAEVIAGFAGSALHSLILAKDVAGRVVIVPRSDTLNENYATIARAKGWDQSVIPIALKHVSGSGPRSVHELTDIAKLVNDLRHA